MNNVGGHTTGVGYVPALVVWIMDGWTVSSG
jgi:hypothetical protein